MSYRRPHAENFHGRYCSSLTLQLGPHGQGTLQVHSKSVQGQLMLDLFQSNHVRVRILYKRDGAPALPADA
jgi:hypothetical protein